MQLPLTEAILNLGSSGLWQHYVHQLTKKGELKVIALGGSITEGAKATLASERWAQQFAGGLEPLFKQYFQTSNPVQFINAGFGATDSGLGVHRLERHVLEQNPDLVLLEFAANDVKNPHHRETFEGLIRQLRTLDIPILILSTLWQDGSSTASTQLQLAQHYDVPLVSAHHLLSNHSLKSEHPQLWQHFIADEVHPNSNGHKLYAQLMLKLLEHGLKSAAASEPSAVSKTTPLPSPLFGASFSQTRMLNTTNFSLKNNRGWWESAGSPYGPLGPGWEANNQDDFLEITFHAQNLSVAFYRAPIDLGQAWAQVDNASPVLLQGYFEESWGGYWHWQVLATNLNPGQTHRLKIWLDKNHHPQSRGGKFWLQAIMLASSTDQQILAE